MKQVIYDLIIIGAGPTGINIGIEAKKKGLNYLILEKNMLVNSIYNFPSNMRFFSTSLNLEIGQIPFISHDDKPTRREALEYYRRIYESFDLNINFKERTLHINKVDPLFQIRSEKANYLAKYVAIATGFYDHANRLNVPGEEMQKVKHYYDDAHHYIGMHVLVIGGANSACDVALETWQKGAHVTMAVRSKELYQKVKYWILPNIQNRINEGSIKAYFNSEVKEIKKHSVILDTLDGSIEIDNDYVLAMTGYHPNFEFLKAAGIQLNTEHQVPEHNEETLETNIEGLFVAGVINAGSKTSTLFIENTRDHGEKIVNEIIKRK